MYFSLQMDPVRQRYTKLAIRCFIYFALFAVISFDICLKTKTVVNDHEDINLDILTIDNHNSKAHVQRDLHPTKCPDHIYNGTESYCLNNVTLLVEYVVFHD